MIIPPIVINSNYLPNDLRDGIISEEKLPNIYTRKYNYENTDSKKMQYIKDVVKVGSWTHRKEARIRDKFIKIRVRYSGKNLAVIHSIITLYNISYS
jgi:hypothetical protein